MRQTKEPDELGVTEALLELFEELAGLEDLTDFGPSAARRRPAH